MLDADKEVLGDRALDDAVDPGCVDVIAGGAHAEHGTHPVDRFSTGVTVKVAVDVVAVARLAGEVREVDAEVVEHRRPAGLHLAPELVLPVRAGPVGAADDSYDARPARARLPRGTRSRVA